VSDQSVARYAEVRASLRVIRSNCVTVALVVALLAARVRRSVTK